MKKSQNMLEVTSSHGLVGDSISLAWVIYNLSFRSSFCLPFGKADHTPSTALSRARRSLLQPHPRRLVSGASSTFAQLRYKGIIQGRKGKKGPPTSRDMLPGAHENVKSV
jgi:hypothetical protein